MAEPKKIVCTSCNKEVELNDEGKFIGHTDTAGHMCDMGLKKPLKEAPSK